MRRGVLPAIAPGQFDALCPRRKMRCTIYRRAAQGRHEPNGASAGYDRRMDVSGTTQAGLAPTLRDRDQIPDRFKWDLTRIFPDWGAWQAAYAELDRKIAAFAALQGTLAQGDRA